MILAAAGELTGYIDPYKVGTVVVLLFAWAAGVQWIDRDTNVVKTRREHWNMLVLSGAFVAYFVLFTMPWREGLFVVGLLIWAAIAAAPMIGYILHRNGRVAVTSRVLTPGHFMRLVRRQSGPSSTTEAGLRVRLADHAGKTVEPGATPEERRDFDAVQDFLFDLLWRRASEVEMVASKEDYRLVYCVDGVKADLKDGVPLDKGEKVLRLLKRAAGLNVEEIRRPQTGKIQASLLSHEGAVGFTQVQTSGTMQGEKLRLMIQTKPAMMRLPELGIATQRLEMISGFMRKQHGLVILSSPSGNGLTTSQYAILKTHDAYINNIHSLERRPLVDLDNVTQQVYEGDNKDLNYARVLQTVLRREPDIVLVDECDDRETAKIATRAAVENRKIYLGVRAKDCFDAVARYLAWVADNAMASKALLGVVNQRLVRLLCSDCREAYKPDAATLKKLNLPAEKIEQFYRPPTEVKRDKRGREIVCPKCQGTGYVGRTGVFEVLAVDPAVAKLIAEGTAMERVQAECRKNKMHYLQEEAILKVIDGTTSMNEVLRCLRTGEK